MNIKRAKEEIKHTVQAYLQKNALGEYRIPPLRQRPLLLMGPPGIGKTQIMEQVARECRIGLVAYTITHHTRQSAVGLPMIRQRQYGGAEHSVTEYTMSEIIASIYEKMERTGLREGILFIDEINCVSETLAPTMLQFLQCKTFGNQAVPQGWIIVAAGNPPEYNRSVREFDLVTLDRVRRMELEPDLPVWREYARAQGLHPAILAYLELRPKNFYRVAADLGGPRFVTARGWEDLSELIGVYEELGLTVDEEVTAQYLQDPEIAQDFAAYLALFHKYRDDYGIAAILEGRVAPAVYQRLLLADFDERLSLVSLLLSGLATRFAAARDLDETADACYTILKSFQAMLGIDQPAQTCYTALCEKYEQELARDQAAGLLDRRTAANRAQAARLLRSWRSLLDQAGQDPFDAVRGGFQQLVRRREQAVAAASAALEHAFDFMENAFVMGQEMTVFVTELTLGPDSAPFLASNGCERFYRYSKELMLDPRKAAIQRELAENDARQDEFAAKF